MLLYFFVNTDQNVSCLSFSHGLKQYFREHARDNDIYHSRVVIDLDVLERSYS